MKRLLGVPPVVPAFLVLLGVGAFAPGVAADWGLFPLLGVFPGVALATLLPLERGALARWALGLAASPLVVTLCAWGLMRAGLTLPLAARVVAAAGLALWLWTEFAVAPREGADAEPREGLRFAWGWSLGAAAIAGLVLFSNPWLRVRIDAWVHAGIVWEIAERGIPPQDPRFAGLTLNYVWFYNYFVALLGSLRGGDPFALMAVSNVASLFGTMGCAWLIGRQLWGTARAAAGSALLLGLSYNGGMGLAWLARVARAWLGGGAGREHARAIVAGSHWNDAWVINDLSFPNAYMVSFLDKPLHGTAINVAYLFLLVYLWAMVRALSGGGRAAFAWGAAAAGGMLFFHGVVGLSAIPVALGALALAWLLAGRFAWLAPRGRLLAFALATLGGVLLAAPYTLAISRAWPAAQSGLHYDYLQADRRMWLTIATSLLLPAWFARHAVARLVSERRGPAAVVALFVAGMLAFSGVVSLPLASHTKFVWQAFAGLALLGGVSFHDELSAWRRRFGPLGAGVLAAVLLLGTPVLTLRGYLLDRTGATAAEFHPSPGEADAYRWMREHTPSNAVFLDRGFRSLVMVEARRQLLLGSPHGPEQAAFPAGETERRRAVLADVYGRCDSLDRDAARLDALGRPVYVLLRAADADTIASPRAALDARADLFERVYDRDGFIVYHRVPTVPTPSPTSGAHRP